LYPSETPLRLVRGSGDRKQFQPLFNVEHAVAGSENEPLKQ
jgi:hypothetical protein